MGRVEAVRRVGRTVPSNAGLAKPVRKRPAHDLIPATLGMLKTLGSAGSNRVNSEASAVPETPARLRMPVIAGHAPQSRTGLPLCWRAWRAPAT